jgi:hypothetical protein
MDKTDIHTLTIEDVLFRDGRIMSYYAPFKRIVIPDNFEGELVEGVQIIRLFRNHEFRKNENDDP